MNDVISSCAVAPLSKTQLRNSTIEDATTSATFNATHDLIALSMQVLAQNTATVNATCNATSQSHHATNNATDTNLHMDSKAKLRKLHRDATNETRVVDTFPKESCAVAFYIGGNYATNKEKKIKLKKLIKIASDNHGGEDDQFLAEYIDDVLARHDLDKALACFEDVVKQKPVFNRK